MAAWVLPWTDTPEAKVAMLLPDWFLFPLNCCFELLLLVWLLA